MSPDVTITISTEGVAARGPEPNLTDETAAAGRAGQVRGPIPLPLDQLPEGGVASVGLEAARGAGSAPIPIDLGQMVMATTDLPSPEDLDAMIAAAGGPTPPAGTSRGTGRRRSPRATNR
jgi:hypothetical protein